MNYKSVLKHAGVTYRQLDMWTRKGHLASTPMFTDPDMPRYRAWSQHEADVALWMRRLVDAGFGVLAVAERVARELVDFPTLPVCLGPGLQIRATDWEEGDDYHPFARDYVHAFVDVHGNEVAR